MCLADSSPRARRLMLFSMGCLVLSLLSQSLSLSFGLRPDLVHFLRGFLIGVAIAAMFGSARVACRSRRNPAP